MTVWSSGDSLSPSNFNTKLASAASVGGYSTNTISTDSGSTLSMLVTIDCSAVSLTNTVYLSTGSSTSPAITFSSEESLGFYRSGNSVVALSHGGFSLPAASATTPALFFSGDTSRGMLSSLTGVIDVISSFSITSGSATTPAIFFSGRTSTGIYSSDTSIIDIQVGSDGTVAIHSVLSVTSIISPAVSSVTSGDLAEGQLFLTASASGFSIGIRSGSTTYWISSSNSTI